MSTREVLMEACFAGKLDNAGQLELDQLLSQDEEVKQQFEFEKNLQVAIRKAEYDRLSEKMKSIEANQTEQSGAVIGKKPTK